MIINKNSKPKPKVSVIIPTHNRAALVTEAINSVLTQTFKDFELIVVDDGSTDNTRDALKGYTDRIHYIYQENQRRSEARNTGIKAASGEYIAFLDDDDLWLPHKLEKQVTFLDANPDKGLVHTFTDAIDITGRLMEKERNGRLQWYKKSMKLGYTYEGISRLGAIFLSSVLLRSRCLEKVGLFDTVTEAYEDWDFGLRFASEYRIGIIPEFLVKFRIHKVHTTVDEFTRGRINTSIKHFTLLNSRYDLPFRNQARVNFYMHLTNAYYIDLQLGMFRTYALKTLRLSPKMLFRSPLGLQFLFSILPLKVIRKFRQLKGEKNFRFLSWP